MEVGLMDIVRSVNRSWISSAYIELFIRGEKSGGKCPGGKCPDTNFHQYFLPIFLSSYFFLIYTYVNLFKIQIHNKLLLFQLTCDLPKYACHYMIINCIFLKKSAEQWNLRVTHEKCKSSVSNY